ncbi:MAG: RNA 2',3'-cyclic phosphodiesterase [Acidimicrobiia bacterium]|nr:RNA 2',3'-cyclic phosphodiesterase [Acidimicrobiia bacterium]
MAELARLFLAVAPDEETRHRLAHLLGDPAALPGRPVHPDNWHLTLRFLGDVGPVGRDRLLGTLGDADLGTPFGLSWSGLGAFPNPRRARVLWLGVRRGAPELEDLAGRVREAVEDAGFDPEERPFSPHLTLSRLRPPEDVRPLVDRFEAPDAAMRVSEVVLFRSNLGGGPARYERVETFAL